MISIPEPCGRSWAAMEGDERRRFCGTCGKFVYAAKAYPEAELAGRCVYLGGETQAAASSRRMVVAGAVLTAISPLLAQDGRIRVEVTDASGAAVGAAEVASGEWRAKADKEGVAMITGLRVGRHTVTVSSPGFKRWTGALNVTNGGEQRLEARLEVGSVGGGMVISLASGIRVQVTDPSGAAVAAGELTALCADRATRKTPVANGYASFQDLPEGNCELTVTVPGFKPWTQSRVLRGGGEAAVEARLELAAAGEKVAVRPKSAGRRFVDWLTSCTRK